MRQKFGTFSYLYDKLQILTFLLLSFIWWIFQVLSILARLHLPYGLYKFHLFLFLFLFIHITSCFLGCVWRHIIFSRRWPFNFKWFYKFIHTHTCITKNPFFIIRKYGILSMFFFMSQILLVKYDKTFSLFFQKMKNKKFSFIL